MSKAPDLSVDLFGIRFKNPVWTASGCFNYGREFAHLFPLSDLGAVVVKGTAPDPWIGNKGTRVTETPGGMLNAIGLQNPGVGYFLETDLPWLKEQNATVVVNIVGRTEEEYVEVARSLEGSGVAAVELNISCPNVKEGGLAFGTNLRMAEQVTAAVRKATTLPLIVKLSPNVTSIVDFAKACEAGGADGLSVINTLLGMSIDIRRKKPVLGNLFGGLSGPAIKPVALRMVWQVAGAVKLPVIGIGGIMTGEDAVEFLMAGARAVQVGTACFVNPRAPIDVRDGIASFMAEMGIGGLSGLIGAARPETGAEGNLPVIGDGYQAPGARQPGAEPTGGAPPSAGSRPSKPGAAPAQGETADALRRFFKEADRA